MKKLGFGLLLLTLALIAQDVILSNRTVKWNKERNLTGIVLQRSPLLNSWVCTVDGYTWERDTNSNERINVDHWSVAVPTTDLTNLPAWSQFENQIRKMVMKTNWDSLFPPPEP